MSRHGLEMQVVGRGSPAAGAVVEHEEIRIFRSEVQHVREMMPYRLGQVLVADYDQMLREYEIWVDLDVVEPALAAFELEVELLRRPVLLAQEALSRRDGLGRSVGGRGQHPDRIVLYAAGQPSDFHAAALQPLQGPEVGRSERPHRELVPYEFIQFVGHSSD